MSVSRWQSKSVVGRKGERYLSSGSCSSPTIPFANSDGRRAISGLVATMVRDSDPAAWEPWMAPLACRCAMFPGDSRGSLPPTPVFDSVMETVPELPPLDSTRVGIRNPAAQAVEVAT